MKKKVRKELDKATLASVKKELAKPRMARSACKIGKETKYCANFSTRKYHDARNRRQNHSVSTIGREVKNDRSVFPISSQRHIYAR